MSGEISIIVATSANLVIGKDNDIPWHIPTDLKNFKKITEGHTVIMGRKCWESIPAKYRPLPNRRNIVITRNEDYIADGAEVVHSLLGAIDISSDDGEVFIIGGSQIYKEGFEYADKLYLTQIEEEVDGDIKLEGLNYKDWSLKESSEPIKENGFTYKFETFIR